MSAEFVCVEVERKGRQRVNLSRVKGYSFSFSCMLHLVEFYGDRVFTSLLFILLAHLLP